MLALKSVDRWRSASGYFFVTKNHSIPAFAFGTPTTASSPTTMATSCTTWGNHSVRDERPSPSSGPLGIGGYASRPIRSLQRPWRTRAACRSRQRCAVRRRSSLTVLDFVGHLALQPRELGLAPRAVRIRGIRDTSGAGVTFARPFLENGGCPACCGASRYRGTLTVTFTHPLLVRCRIDYAPKPGQTGPTMSDDLHHHARRRSVDDHLERGRRKLRRELAGAQQRRRGAHQHVYAVHRERELPCRRRPTELHLAVRRPRWLALPSRRSEARTAICGRCA
jgi:hypothetical protein